MRRHNLNYNSTVAIGGVIVGERAETHVAESIIRLLNQCVLFSAKRKGVLVTTLILPEPMCWKCNGKLLYQCGVSLVSGARDGQPRTLGASTFASLCDAQISTTYEEDIFICHLNSLDVIELGNHSIAEACA